jgi:hypothetical protein
LEKLYTHGFTHDINSTNFSEINIAGCQHRNDRDQHRGSRCRFVVGADWNDVSFIKEGSTIDWLSGPKGALSVQAFGPNNEDQVVGSYSDSTGAMHERH